MFINPLMLEPATASIAVYLLAKTTKFGNGTTRRLLIKRPMDFKRKVCRWVYYNKHELIDIIIDETNDITIDLINQLQPLKAINPSIFLCFYIIALVITIIA